jgi:hypothetical protein
MSTSNKRKRVGDVFLYTTKNDDIINIDHKFINNIGVASVRKLLTAISNHITEFEKNANPKDEDELMNLIGTTEDITYKCVKIARWRRGTGFIFLQLSSMNEGTARVSVFVTNTRHHTAECFGTEPKSPEAKKILNEYLKDGKNVLKDLQILKDNHTTTLSIDYLLTNIIKT